MNVKKKQRDVQRTELEWYLEDGLEDTSPTFNILIRWKGKTNKYHVLSRIARDILAILVIDLESELVEVEKIESDLPYRRTRRLHRSSFHHRSSSLLNPKSQIEELKRIFLLRALAWLIPKFLVRWFDAAADVFRCVLVDLFIVARAGIPSKFVPKFSSPA
ncbi:zinc finger BED domain-containing protein RICESLEEPER [Trifolium repens]|nr:zinc finger BED domain-containing protein RICESLEEPER [Trifolium repens]